VLRRYVEHMMYIYIQMCVRRMLNRIIFVPLQKQLTAADAVYVP